MSKPLARYAEDEDLEKRLKERDRDGDPMLAFIKKTRKVKMEERGLSQRGW
jgi:pre-mRNA-splicing factor CWC26